MSKLTFTLVLIGTLFAQGVFALGLSHIQVSSNLNEPLRAKINILSIPKGGSSTIRVALASSRAFNRAGLERSLELTKMRFTVKNINKTSAIINVTSQRPIKEPYLNFLVEVKWSGGRILREYTALLNPPLYKPNRIKTLSRQEPTRTSVQPRYEKPKYSTKYVPPRVIKKARTQKRSKKRQQRTTRRSTKRRSIGKTSSYVIARNDTLWKIALRSRPKGTSLQQQMNRIYNANPSAFIRRNRNLLKTGKVLRIPGGKKLLPASSYVARQESPRRTSTAPRSRVSKKQSPKVKATEPKLRLAATDSLAEKAGVVNTPQSENAQLKRLREEVLSLQSENKALKEKKTQTGDLKTVIEAVKKEMKKELDELNNKFQVQSQKMATLQTQLKQREIENKELEKQLALLKSGKPQNERMAELERENQKLKEKLANLNEAPDDLQVAENKPQIKITPTFTIPNTSTSSKTGVESAEDESAEGDESAEAESAESKAEGDESAEGKKSDFIKVKEVKEEKEEKEESFITPILLSVNTVHTMVEENVPGSWMTVGGIGGGSLILSLLAGFLRRKSKTTGPAEWKDGTELTDEELQEELARLEEEGKPDETGELISDELSNDEFSPEIQGLIEEAVTQEDAIDLHFDKELQDNLKIYMENNSFALAEDILEEGIQKYPRHNEYRLQLLEVHAAANNIDEFDKQAQLLHDSVKGQGPLWQKTLALRENLSTTSQSGTGAGAAVVGAAVVGAAVATAAIAGNEAEDSTATLEGLEEFNIEEEITTDTADETLKIDDESDDLSFGLDDDLSFDLEEEESVDSSPDVESVESDESLDLGLDDELSIDLEESVDSSPDVKSVESDESLDLGLDDELSIDLDESVDSSTEVESDESFDLDDELSIDLDESVDSSPSVESVESDESLDLGLDDELSIDLDESVDSSTEVESDESLDLDFDDELSFDLDDTKETAIPTSEDGDVESELASDDSLGLDENLL
ncbi:MAG: LysM peptidoglycan-binding domain-containing protein, partial [Thiomargarita sp.]|nr:LysM peptidoglycan-binding domain-containing protein [Thiomargarita sp.]